MVCRDRVQVSCSCRGTACVLVWGVDTGWRCQWQGKLSAFAGASRGQGRGAVFSVVLAELSLAGVACLDFKWHCGCVCLCVSAKVLSIYRSRMGGQSRGSAMPPRGTPFASSSHSRVFRRGRDEIGRVACVSPKVGVFWRGIHRVLERVVQRGRRARGPAILHA